MLVVGKLRLFFLRGKKIKFEAMRSRTELGLDSLSLAEPSDINDLICPWWSWLVVQLKNTSFLMECGVQLRSADL